MDTHEKWFVLKFLLAVLALVISVDGLAGEAPGPPANDPALRLYYNANALYARRLYEPAIEQYEEFLKANPGHAKVPLAEWGLAICYYSLEKFDKAAPLFAKLAGNPLVEDQEQLHNLWGSCLLELKNPAEAEKALAWTVQNGKTASRKMDAMAALVEALFLQSKWAEVVKVSEDLVKAGPDSPYAAEVRYQGAVARSKLTPPQYDAAAAVFAALIKESKDESLVHRATFQLAECQQRTDKLKQAAESYAAAAKTKTGVYSEYAQYNLGIVQFLLKDYAQAVAELTVFRQKYPQSASLAQADLYLGRAHLEAKTFPAAEATLSALLANKAVAGGATLWLARAYARQGKFAEVEKLLGQAATAFAKDPALPELLYELATAQMSLKKYKEAAEAYAAAGTGAGPGPLAVESLRLQAFCLHSAGQYAGSLKLCEAFLAQNKTHPEVTEVLFLKGENLTLLKQAEAAVPIYEAVIAADPKHPRAALSNLRLAQTYYEKGDWKNCLAKLTPLLEGNVAGAVFDQVWYMVGACQFRLGDWGKAIAAFEKFIKEKADQPNVDTAMYNLALAYQYQKAPDKAKAMATLAELVTNPKYQKSERLQDALVELGRLQYEAKELVAARATLVRVAADGPPAAQYYLGWVALGENKDAEAAQFFAAMGKHPQHAFAADAALQLALLQIRAKQHKEAQATLTGLLAGYKDYGKKDQAIYYLGLSLARQDQYAPAIVQFVAVRKEHPKSDKADKALYWQAWCEKLSKHPDVARKLYEGFLADYAGSELASDVSVELSELEFEQQTALERAAAEKTPGAGLPAEVKQAYGAIVKRLETLDVMKKLGDGPLRNRALYVLGWCCFKTDDMSKSAKAFEDLMGSKEAGELAGSAWFQAGEARMKLREYEAACQHFTKAAAIQGPQHEAALLRRAQTEALTNKWPQSQASTQEFVKVYPASKFKAQAQFALGWALENQKQYAEAIPVYAEIVKAGAIDEISARSQFQIGECLFNQNKLDEAIPQLIMVDSAYSAFPEWNSKALLEMGRVLEAQGKKDKAAERYKEVMSRFPKTDAAEVAENLLKKLSGG